MNFGGFIKSIVNNPALQGALAAQGVNVDPAYQQPAGPNSAVPQTNNAITSAVERANQSSLGNASALPGGGGGGTAVPMAPTASTAPNRAPSALMTDRAIVERFPFLQPAAPGSLGEVFQQMVYNNRPDLQMMRDSQPEPAPAPRPTNQMQGSMQMPVPNMQNPVRPSYSPVQQQNTAISRFLSGRRSGGISDLLAARMGV